jgi:hypothetical protein
MKQAARYKQFSDGYLKHLDDEFDVAQIDGGIRQNFLDLVLDTDTPLHPMTRQYVGYFLRAFLFPASSRQRLERHHAVEAGIVTGLIKYLAQKYKAQGVRKPVAKAIEEVAASSGLSVETMQQRIKRARRPQQKGGQKS